MKNQTIAANGTTSLEAGDLRIHLRNVVENKQIIATSVTMLVHNMAILESIWNTQRRKVKQMQPVWFCIYSGRQFENAFESSQWREAKQMQPMWLRILRDRRCEGTFAIHSGEKPPLLGDLGVKLLKHHYLNSPPPPSRPPVISRQPVTSQSSFLTTSSDPFCWLPLSPSRPPCQSHCRPPRTPPSWSPPTKKYWEKME